MTTSEDYGPDPAISWEEYERIYLEVVLRVRDERRRALAALERSVRKARLRLEYRTHERKRAQREAMSSILSRLAVEGLAQLRTQCTLAQVVNREYESEVSR